MRLFFNKTFTVEKLSTTSGKESYSASGSISGGIYAISPDDIILTDGDASRSSVLFCDETSNIKVTDRITDDAGNKYTVRSVKVPNRLLTLDYKRCIIEKLAS